MKKLLLLLFNLLLINCLSYATNWLVGSTQAYTLPSQLVNVVQDGDTISIEGGVYLDDATKWVKKNLKLIGLGSNTNRTIIRYNGNIPNGKGIFVFESPGICDNPYLENIVFDGAQVTTRNGANGAGIRFQANNITINNCKFMNCQNGILEGHGSVSTSNVIIENSEFENNGYQEQNNSFYSGYEHHIYISASTDTLIVRNCYFHHPRGQANSIKTRAQRSYILYNMIDEEETGYGSWEINIAQGGLNVIMGNVIIQGTSGANHGIVGYDAVTNNLEDFYFVNNTVINKYSGIVRYFNIVPSTGINTFKIYNNIFSSTTNSTVTMFSGNVPTSLDSSNNNLHSNYLTYGFTNPNENDYSLTEIANGIDEGIVAGVTNTSFILSPTYMYQSFSSTLLPRVTINNAIDIGAYEYGNLSVNKSKFVNKIIISPNPSNGKFMITINELSFEDFHFSVSDINGNNIEYQLIKGNNQIEIDLSSHEKGVYFLKGYYNSINLFEKIVIK